MSSFQSLFNESNLSINLVIAVDNITIDYNSTGQLEVKDGGISTNKIANLAVTNAKINDMDASKLTGTVTIPINTSLVEATTVLVSYGSLGTPSIAFILEPTTGIYHSAVGEMSFTSSGTAIFKINSTGLSILSGQLLVQGGLNSAPSIALASDPTTGIFRYASTTLGISSGGSTVATFNTSGVQTLVPLTTNGQSFACGVCSTTGLFVNGNSVLGSNSATSTGYNKVQLIGTNASSAGPHLEFFTTADVYPLMQFLNFAHDELFLSFDCYYDGSWRASTTTANYLIQKTINALNFNYSSGGTAGNTTNIATQTALSIGPTGTISFPLLTASSSLYLNSSKVLNSVALTNGQLLIGSTSNTPVAATITGTSNQVNVANAAGSITLSLPQSIATSSTPTFGGGFINGSLVVGTSSAISTGSYKLEVVGTDSSGSGPFVEFFTNGTGSDTYPLMSIVPFAHNNVYLNFDAYFDGSWKSSSTTSNFLITKRSDVFSINYFAGATQGSVITNLSTNQALTVNTSGQVGLPLLSANSSVYLNSSKNFTGTVLTNGQLLIGRTGNTPLGAAITGTTNQVNVTNGSGSITLSLPQSIATTSTPTFGGLFINGTPSVFGASAAINTGAYNVQVIGGVTNNAGPHMEFFTTSDVYPLLQFLNWQHDNVNMNFDCYFDGSWKSSSANGNFQISKGGNVLNINYGTGTAGSASTVASNTAMQIDINGRVAIGTSLINTGSQRLMLYGTDNSSSSTNNANLQTFTTADNYPLFQLQSQQHNNVNLAFDTYWDGSTYRSSNSGSNFLFGKSSNQLKVLYGSGTAQGSVPTLNVASYWDTNGNFQCNNTIFGNQSQMAAQPCLMLSASSYISVSTGTTTQFSGFDTTIYTSGSIGFAGGIATVPSVGTYLVCAEMCYDATSTGTGNYDELYIYYNSATVFGRQRIPISTGNIMYVTTSATIRMAASDTIQIYVAQNSGANLHCGTLSGSTARLEITKLH